MLEKEKLDVVDICLPTLMHRKAIIKCGEAGLDVMWKNLLPPI